MLHRLICVYRLCVLPCRLPLQVLMEMGPEYSSSVPLVSMNSISKGFFGECGRWVGGWVGGWWVGSCGSACPPSQGRDGSATKQTRLLDQHQNSR